MKIKALFIVDLQHATPRVPAFIKALGDLGWDIRVLDIGIGDEIVTGTSLSSNALKKRLKDARAIKNLLDFRLIKNLMYLIELFKV